MVDRSSYYTTDQTPFVGQSLISDGLGYLMQRARNVQPFHRVPVRIGTRPYPGGDTGIGQAMNSGIGALRDRINNVAPFGSTPITISPKAFPKPTKQHKEIAKAALKASEARSALDDKLANSDIGKQVQQADTQQRYEQAVQAALAQASQPVAQQPATMPQAGGIGGPPVTGLDPRDLGPPQNSGIATLLGNAPTALEERQPPDRSLTPMRGTSQPGTNFVPSLTQDINLMPGAAPMILPKGRAVVGNPNQPHYPSAQVPDPEKAGFISDVLDVLPDSTTKLVADNIGKGPQQDPDAFIKQLEGAIKPRGPYGSGGTDMGDALSWAGDKIQQGMDYMATVPVPGVLRDPVGTVKSLVGDGKGKGETTVDPSLDPTLPPDEALPDGTTKEDTSTSDLDAQLERYLTESDNSYDDALKTINTAYGGLEQPQKDPRQDAADAYAARDADRTAALAQLAMAGGLIKSAGKSWEGAGQGVMDAAGVYSQGFDRYQKALNDSADRAYTRQQADRAFEISKRGAALTMWQSGQTDRRAMIKDLFTLKREELKDARTEKRSLAKDTREHIDKVFAEQAKVIFPTDGTSDTDSPEYKAKLAAFRAAWRRSYSEGRLIFPEDMGATEAVDVSDK